MLFECVVPSVPVILLALQEDLAPFVRSHLLMTLWRIAAGAPSGDEPAAVNRDLLGESYAAVAKGIDVIYREAVTGDTETALDILELVETDEVRLTYYRSALKGRLAKRGSI